jgi:hypothetical protein
MLHASSPHSVTLMQLRFTSLVVTNLRRDLHPQECAHAGRTNQGRLAAATPLPALSHKPVLSFACPELVEGSKDRRRERGLLLRLPGQNDALHQFESHRVMQLAVKAK